jgi:hypothetical protein
MTNGQFDGSAQQLVFNTMRSMVSDCPLSATWTISRDDGRKSDFRALIANLLDVCRKEASSANLADISGYVVKIESNTALLMAVLDKVMTKQVLGAFSREDALDLNASIKGTAAEGSQR